MAQKHIRRKNPTKSRSVERQAVKSDLTRVLTLVENKELKSNLPAYKAGDSVKVHVRIKEGTKERIQLFEGVVIKIGNRGPHRSFTVRKMSHGVGVERVFLESSPKVAKLEITQIGKIRRAKLYYLRGLEGKKARITRDVAASKNASNSAAQDS